MIAVEPGHGATRDRGVVRHASVARAPRVVPPQDALKLDPEAPALFVASSGSTGDPKLIAMSTRVLGKRLGLRGYPARRARPDADHGRGHLGKTPRLYAVWLGCTSVFRESAAETPLRRRYLMLSATPPTAAGVTSVTNEPATCTSSVGTSLSRSSTKPDSDHAAPT